MPCNAPKSIPCIVQGDRRASLDALSGVSGFSFLKLFKDGSGALYDESGKEIAGFFDVKDLQRISETRLEALNRYSSKVERRRVAGYRSDDPEDRQGVHTLNSRWQVWGHPGPGAKDLKDNHPVVVQEGSEADLRLLAYFHVFSSETWETMSLLPTPGAPTSMSGCLASSRGLSTFFSVLGFMICSSSVCAVRYGKYYAWVRVRVPSGISICGLP